MAAAMLTNQIMKTEKALADGEYMYNTYCEHCHGAKGNGDGLVAEKYTGVANLNSRAFENITSGHIYHVITMGKGRMSGHGSQIKPADRWKIVHFVNELRGYDDRKDPVRVLSDYEIAERTEIIEDEENGKATILFPFGASATTVNTKLESYLSGVAKELGNSSLTIVGHTDNVDTREVNLPLGLQRADYIKNILVSLGVDGAQITTESMAFDNPVADNATVDGRRQNRRAELIFN
jgi:outer membrane protein OmpA-like peptidoglycan-associated protein